MESPVSIHCIWHEKRPKNGRMRDFDNVSFAIKFILDAMVDEGVITDDGFKHVKRISHEYYMASGDPFIEVIVEEIEE